MIGVDTNVLLRVFVADDPVQARAASAFIEAPERPDDPVFVTALVLVELVWTLRKAYDHSKPELLSILDQVCSHATIIVDDRDAVETAVDMWRTGKADFADYLIAALARERGARTTMTFDRTAAETAAFTLLTA
jgi:predicted nucleic-acid-binding protein